MRYPHKWRISSEQCRDLSVGVSCLQLANCRRCGRLFLRQCHSEVCGSCSDLEEHRLRQVKDYLYRRPGAPLNTVVQDTGVELGLIRRWIDEGRLGQR